MKAKLKANTRSTSSLVKKIAILRILLRKPRIVIIKDADEFIDSLYITALLKEEIPDVTIIKISQAIEQSIDVDRLIAMENLTIMEQGAPDDLKENPMSKVGREIEDINMKSYTFTKKVSKKSQMQTPLIWYQYLYC